MQVKIVRMKETRLTLRVEGGEVVAYAPLHMSEQEIAAFLHRHRRWLNARLERARPALTLRDGEEVSLFGKIYVLASGRARLTEPTLYLPAEGREGALIRLMKREVGRVLGELTKALAQRYGFCVNGVRVTSARGRWGSCSAGERINYSFRAAFLPPELLEYLCVHELCHTRHMDHSPAFWQEVARILPDFQARRKRLKEASGYMRLL